MNLRSAVFLDRDGVINAMIWNGHEFDSPLRASQVDLLPRVGQAIRMLNEAGWPVVVVSNQPVIAKGKATAGDLEHITRIIQQRIQAAGARLDAIYYCLHHPLAILEELRGTCDCRKPAPGLLRRAASDLGLALPRSFMVGDRPTDVQAGRAAGCTTILTAGEARADTTDLPADAEPEHVVSDLFEAVCWILERTKNGWPAVRAEARE